MPDPNELRTLAILILRTIASALMAYGLVQVLIGVLGPVVGIASAALFRSQGGLHLLAGLVVWLVAGPIARVIAKGLG